MKKLLSIMLSLCFIMALCGCDGFDFAYEQGNDPTPKLSSGANSFHSMAPPLSNWLSFDVDVDLPDGYTGTKEQFCEEITSYFYSLDCGDASADELITVSYPEEEIVSFIQPMMDGKYMTLYELNQHYPVEYIRMIWWKNSSSAIKFAHCIYKLNEGGYLYVFINSEAEYVDRSVSTGYKATYGKWWMVNAIAISDRMLTQKDFDSIEEGDTLEAVEKIDGGTARLNAIRTDYLNAGCQYGDLYDYPLPGTLHIVDDGVMVIVYENLKDTGGEYIVKSIFFLDMNPERFGITSFFVDYDRQREDMFK